MRLVRVALLAFATTSMLAACGEAREVEEGQGGAHALPFLVQHPAAARSRIASCKVCHGNEYNGGSAESCDACHGTFGYAGWKTNCTFCHGTRTALAPDPVANGTMVAPPQSAANEGEQTPANPKVGAHQAHLTAGTFGNALLCTSCHAPVPTVFPGSLNHVNGTASLQFNALASTGVATPAYTGGAAGKCAVYCHGNPAALGGNMSPEWTTSTAIACGSCHSLAPDFGEHKFHAGNLGLACEKCHPGYTTTSVNLDTHLSGNFDVSVNTSATTKIFTNSTSGGSAPEWPATCSVCHTNR